MSIRIDTQFIQRLSSRLDNFSQKKPTLFNCRCPICGDSQKSKSKARGYFYPKKGGMFYKCHNCGIGTSLGNIIKEVDSELYHEYRMERWKSGDTRVKKPKVFKYHKGISSPLCLDKIASVSIIPKILYPSFSKIFIVSSIDLKSQTEFDSNSKAILIIK